MWSIFNNTSGSHFRDNGFVWGRYESGIGASVCCTTMRVFHIVGEVDAAVVIVAWSEGECSIVIVLNRAMVSMQISDSELTCIVGVYVNSIRD